MHEYVDRTLLTNEDTDERSEKPDCMFLMVQSIYPANHFWNCYYNDHPFNAKKDLNCSKDASIWGTAKGYK
jgi:hypothetical protein